jgi:hypothetical protein
LTYFNDPNDVPDPLPSPLGTYSFAAAYAIDAVSPSPGPELVALTLWHDDGGSDFPDAGVIVIGTAEDTESTGWWKHQYSGDGAPHIDDSTAAAYLAIVDRRVERVLRGGRGHERGGGPRRALAER